MVEAVHRRTGRSSGGTRTTVERGVRGTRLIMDAHHPWREVIVCETRTRVDFALAMTGLVDELCPQAERIRVVLDNLNTHNAASLDEAFPAAEARRVMRSLELHHAPTHGSWLDMVEFDALTRQCLDRRIGELEVLRNELAACVADRNSPGVKIDWLLDVGAARQKMKRHDPEPKCLQAMAA